MKFKFLPVYKYNLKKFNFMDQELSSEEVERNNRLLADDLLTHFSKTGGTVEM